ncbi:acyltransferase family protein [Agarilytica rhodophyticola]|uniref:acyltransferase family protein n=1 Tax=Agarilytica rhodophyticola TaxID=1737490 RepID=UPI00131A115D|nr:acyltransferase family protein [Agarilytica rhodophyticola]
MNYRADIDGIRAIAVSIVILFHFSVPGFSGGFIGVDVFFVLSGYLISSIIFSQLEKGKFEFGNFYFRRIRRLFPVYIVVMLATFAVAYALMLPKEFREFGQSLLASTVYVSNILFYLQAGYFDTSSHLKPLLHTWSLSVEEQFYLIFPFVAWVTAKFSRKSLFILFATLTLASFAAAAYYIHRDNSAVFYLYPFRAWEMFLGTLLATQFIPQLKSKLSNDIAAVCGLLLIIIPNFFYDSSTLFPGVSALAPCLGTVLLLYTGVSHSGWVQRILSSSPPVFIGKLSYSLYLWHWPVYVLYTYGKPEGADTIDICIMSACTFIASLLSWKFVETPIRKGQVVLFNNKVNVFTSTALVSVLFMAVGFYIHSTLGMPNRLDSKTAAFAVAASDLFGDFENCEENTNKTLPNIGFCAIGSPFTSTSYTLVWGDSHGGAYKRGYKSLVEGKDHNVLVAWDGGCPPIYNFNKDESVSSTVVDEQCSKRNQAVRRLIERDSRINAIVMVGRWSYYINGGGVGIDAENKITIWPDGAEPGSVDDEAAYFVDAFTKTLEVLTKDKHKVFVVEQPPEFTRYLARTLAINLMNGSADFEKNLAELATQDYPSVLARQGKMQTALDAVEQRGLATILRTHKYFCSESTCSLMINDAPTYFDNNHVSSLGAVQIKTMFSPVVEFLEAEENRQL